MMEEYRVDGRLHRERGPAKIARDEATGIVTLEEYRVNGFLHRDSGEGPAFLVRYAKTGVIVREHYREKGRWHRDPSEGPAVIERRPDGTVSEERYWQHGEQVTGPRRGVSAQRRLEPNGKPSP